MAALAVVAAGALASCGSGPSGDSGKSDLPALTVRDLRTAGQVELGSLAPSRHPTVLWMWGPGCAICNREATRVDRFAARERERLTLVGLGSHGSPESAPRFVRDHDMRNMQVLWDQESKAWDRLRVPAEPVTIVFDRSGRELDRAFGPFDEEGVLRVASRVAG